MNEIWKDINGFEGFYQVNNYGTIRSIDRYVNHPKGGKKIARGKITNQYIGTHGYYIVVINKDGKTFTKTVHRLMAIAFLDNPENKREVNHKDGNKLNNNLSNLEWNTSSENRQHAFDNDLQKGSKHLLGKKGELCINSRPVYKILSDGFRERYVSTTDAQLKTGVDRSMISKCAKGKMKLAGGFKWEYA